MLEMVAAGCAVAAVGIGYDHRIVLWNAAAEALTGWPEEAVVGADLSVIMPPEDGSKHRGWVRMYLDRYHAGAPRLMGDVRQVKMRHRDGRMIATRIRLIHVNAGSKIIFAWLSPAQLEE